MKNRIRGCCRVSSVAGFLAPQLCCTEVTPVDGIQTAHLYDIKCVGKGRVLCGIEKLRAVPRKVNVSPCLVLVLKPNLTYYCRPKLGAIAQKWAQSYPTICNCSVFVPQHSPLCCPDLCAHF